MHTILNGILHPKEALKFYAEGNHCFSMECEEDGTIARGHFEKYECEEK